MTIEIAILDFLTKHKDANEIVMDMRTDLPVKAIYSGYDSTGNLRTQDAIFYFEDDYR